MNIRYCLSLLVFACISSSAFAQLSINEIMASNSTIIADNEGEFDDWIEIYNAGSVSINLAGLYLSDDPGDLTKWQIPNTSSSLTTVNANDYLIIWLDNDSEQGAHHVDFKLSADGEFIALTNADGTSVIDSLSFGEQTTDLSLGRQTDGTGDFRFLNPTPNAKNDGSVVAEISDSPSFSIATGFYSGTQTIGISAQANAEIRFETGGKVPTSNSTLYTSPIQLDTSTVIRAIAIESGKQPSETVTNTFLFETTHTIPVVSFVMEPDSLFDFEKGMYVIGDSSDTNGQYPFFGANFWEDFQYPLNIEYMNEFGNPEFEFMAEAEIGGNFSRGFLKKSFVINNNDEFGLNRLQYPLFPENDYDEYDGFVLRAGAEERSRLLNELMRTINLQWNHKNAMQSYEPAALYINGKYWGIYNIYERKNDDFVESRYGFDDIDMIKDYDQVTDGDALAYNELINNFNESLTGDAFFDYAKSVIDFDSFTDHWVYQLYTSHGDPNNVRYWRPRQEDGKWHYISYDFDWWRNLGDNPSEFYSSLRQFINGSTGGFKILGRMLENERYEEIFLNRLADLLNTSFQPDYMMTLIDSIDTAINPEMTRDIARWSDGWYDNGGPTDYDMEYIKEVTEDYIFEIPEFIYSEIADTLGNDTTRVTLASTSNGTVNLNSISPDISENSWSGIYFTDTEISLVAKPAPGYQVANWFVNDESYSTSNSISIPLQNSDPIEISVSFQEITDVLVINEINYNSSDDFGTGDWVEIFNTMNEAVDVSGWVFKDQVDSNSFVIPNNTVLEAFGYLVIADDTTKLKTVNPDARNYIGDFAFNLSGSGEELRLFNADGGLVDVLTYSDDAPWPTEADGDGSTLELINSTSDNTLAASWMASVRLGGTPGWENGTIPTSNENDLESPNSFALDQNYPNPFNPSTNISFRLPSSVKVNLTVYNMLGQKVKTLIDGNLNSGTHTIQFNAGNLSSGVYLYQLRTPTTSLTQRMVLVK